ncbi:hypothetical protein KP509_31G039300 [Ceratopteris richardii]|uniref:Sfi1 spindle body domain-containing protein n=1 Tax=Ceratopteris richardii TaxID=49495 RepID=A0A8T2QY02_CERRI|nr:hypothetical protein KP509_31G039300 [Ceratopteris richardii]
MDESDEDPSSAVHRGQQQLPPRKSKLAIFDASLHQNYQPLTLDYAAACSSSLQTWHPSHHLASGRSSRGSTDSEDLELVRETLRQRRLSRHSALLSNVPSADTHTGIKAIKLAIQEHELPVKMAYKQLDELAANAERVRVSIERNRSLLLLQVKRNNSRYTRAAFTGWRQYVDRKIDQRAMLNHAKMRIIHGLLSRVFKIWHYSVLRCRRFKKFLSRVQRILDRHLFQQIWKYWVTFIRQQAKKHEDRRKEKKFMKDMHDTIRERLARRAEALIHRKRLERLFHGFIEGCRLAKMNHCFLWDLHQFMSKKKIGRIFNAWNQLSKKRSFERRAVMKMRNKHLRACFRAWRNKDFYMDNCLRKIQRKCLAIVFAVWVNKVARKKEICSKLRRKRLFLYFNALKQGCKEASQKRYFQQKLSRKLLNCKLRMAFQAWMNFMEIQEQKKILKLQDYVTIIEKENERSKQECSRLARIVESGEWASKQHAEILEAKDALSVERQALAELITRLNNQQVAVMEQKEKNDNEIRHFKDQLFGHNFIHHNKMLIRGASSFNTIVRALKMEALKRGANQEFLCALDRLAMDKVCVFPDGEIRVKTFCNFEKGKWVPKVTGSSLPDLSASCNTSLTSLNKH